MKFQWRLSLYAVLVSIFLAGCAPTTAVKESTLTPEEQSRNKINQLLSDAQTETPAKASVLRAQAVRLLQKNGDNFQIPNLLEQISIGLLPANMQLEFTLLKAKTAFDNQQYLRSITVIEQLQSSNLASNLTPAEKIQLNALKAESQMASSQPFPALKTLIKVSLLQSNEEQLITHDLIWSHLLSIDPQLVSSQLRTGTNSYYEQGWLELVSELSSKKQLDTQYQAFNNWKTLWQSHPAFLLPPSAISGLTSSTLQASKLAILLPFEGKLSKAAETIKAGILMAHYRTQTPGSSAPELLFLDSTKINTSDQLEAVIQQESVDLVIGPLSKDYVDALVQARDLSIPVLALNYADDLNREGVIQFGLSTDDEAMQLAERVWQEGHKRVAVLTPNTKWGNRLSKQFSEHFNVLGGSTNSHVLYGDTDKFSEDVSQLLNTDASKQRYKQVRQTLYTKKIEFEEHRRTDIDAIVLAALPNDARQLTPILAFNFAGDLPIYASSHVFSGTPDTILDQDLNRIKFLDTPWSLAAPSQNKALLTQQKSDINSRLGRLYALGLDAYRLHPYLKQLAAVPGTEITGETGTLSLDQNGRVKRKLIWAQYKDGIPQLIE